MNICDRQLDIIWGKLTENIQYMLREATIKLDSTKTHIQILFLLLLNKE